MDQGQAALLNDRAGAQTVAYEFNNEEADLVRKLWEFKSLLKFLV